MFSLGQKVVCFDASGQPTLQEGKVYTIWALQDGRGIRVTSDNGDTRHSFSVDRFVPVEVAPVEVAPVEVAPVEVAPVEVAPVEAAPVSELVGMPDTFDNNRDEGGSVLVVDGIAYNVDVIWNAAIGRWTLSDVTRLTRLTAN